jgi:predicted nucleic acid-binding protein
MPLLSPLLGDEMVTLVWVRFSDAWALLVPRLRASGRKVPVNDSWIAATAIAHRVPIVTQDSDYDAMPDVEVIKL